MKTGNHSYLQNRLLNLAAEAIRTNTSPIVIKNMYFKNLGRLYDQFMTYYKALNNIKDDSFKLKTLISYGAWRQAAIALDKITNSYQTILEGLSTYNASMEELHKLRLLENNVVHETADNIVGMSRLNHALFGTPVITKDVALMRARFNWMKNPALVKIHTRQNEIWEALEAQIPADVLNRLGKACALEFDEYEKFLQEAGLSDWPTKMTEEEFDNIINKYDNALRTFDEFTVLSILRIF